MKVIGTGVEKKLLVEINKDELEILLGSYYAKNIPGSLKKVSELKAGDIVDVELMYGMTLQLEKVCDKMASTQEEFIKAQHTLLSFAEIVINKESTNA